VKKMARVKNIKRQSISTAVYARSAFVRRHGDITKSLLIDYGGADCCSESRKQLIKRFATAAVLTEQLEMQLTRGERIDMAAYSLLCNTLVRITQAIGLDRTRTDSMPRLVDVLRSQEEE
jgi:hypothetical protein